uniref:C2H2-type domain-containing protein n=1 Tax=Glossina brevipalpis TaxID=37001 RepID=A0A1A9WRG2_9MUSC
MDCFTTTFVSLYNIKCVLESLIRESLTLNNNNNNNIEAGLTPITNNTANTNVVTNTNCGSASGSNSNQLNAPPLLQLKPKMTIDPNTPTTMTRIGSIGRTTIACITPAGTGPVVGSHNGSVGMNTAAALAAAGVELDTVDDSMTEVIVKIENSASSINDEDEEAPEESEEPDDDDTELNYDIKLSSPMEWSLDAVKIEQEEEFEDILSAGQDLADEDLLTTAAASAKLAAESNDACNMPRKRRTLLMKKSSALNSAAAGVTHIELQTPEQLLEQQQHLQNLQLKPNLPVQIKLHSIPATITTITPQMPRSTAPPLAPLTPKPLETPRSMSNIKSTDYQSMLSKDKRYRILVQNQRMRKESLEHSQDMIYNADIEKPWVCRNCNRNYKWKNSLKCHLKNECGQPPRYFCSKLCGYATNVHITNLLYIKLKNSIEATYYNYYCEKGIRQLIFVNKSHNTFFIIGNLCTVSKTVYSRQLPYLLNNILKSFYLPMQCSIVFLDSTI